MMTENKPTGETFEEGSDIPPSKSSGKEATEEQPLEQSPVEEYWNSLDDSEKEELCKLAEIYKAEKPALEGEVDLSDMES